MRISRTTAPLAFALVLVALLAWQVWAAVGDGLIQAAITGGGGELSRAGFQLVGAAAQPVTGHSAGGNFELESGLWLGGSGQTGTAVDEPVPGVHRLLGARPNPFNPRTEIRFELASATRVRIDVHDVRGHLVRTLVDESKPSGMHSVLWDGTDESGRRVASGTYYLRLTADDRVETRKVSLLK